MSNPLIEIVIYLACAGAALLAMVTAWNIACSLAILAFFGMLDLAASLAGVIVLVVKQLFIVFFVAFMELLKFLSTPVRSAFGKSKNWAADKMDSWESPVHNMSPDNARAILGLLENFTKSDLTEAWRRMMERVHPDKGGSDALSAIVNGARETILKDKGWRK
jgi:DnaJ homolog subfamily C member 19